MMIKSGVWIRLSVLGVDRVCLEVGSYNRGHGVGVREIKMAVRYPSSPPSLPPALLCKTKVSSYWVSSTHPNGLSIPNTPFQPFAQRFPRKTQFVTSINLVDQFQDSPQNCQWFLKYVHTSLCTGWWGWTIRETREGVEAASPQPLRPFAKDPHTRKRGQSQKKSIELKLKIDQLKIANDHHTRRSYK